ncbi:hypothetical protein, partial [Blautia sp. MB18-30]|uniref:hypothetical protein n=1 Tax=Blautia sp. MB18-30 TaxID=2949744 RepID=UPI00202EC197
MSAAEVLQNVDTLCGESIVGVTMVLMLVIPAATAAVLVMVVKVLVFMMFVLVILAATAAVFVMVVKVLVFMMFVLVILAATAAV